MKATELMIGDWVNSLSPSKVIQISEDRIELYNNRPCYDCDYGYKFGKNKESFYEITPIPLTDEILEKNGFRAETFLSSEWGCEVYFREFPGCVVEPDDAGYTFGTISYWGKQANDGSPEDWGTMYESRIKGLHYAHELQHALRLCGLDELADNFIV